MRGRAERISFTVQQPGTSEPALNANTWDNNRLGISPVWFNRHQSAATSADPSSKTKHSFALYDRQDQVRNRPPTLLC
jgi:hypothetical protein